MVYTAYILLSIAKTIVDATTNVDNSANTNAGKPGCFRFTPIYPDIHVIENISDSATRENGNTSSKPSFVFSFLG